MERQQELIRINKVLAVLVVLLAFLAGYLLAEKEQWLKIENPETVSEVLSPAGDANLSVPTASASALVAMLNQARYQRMIAVDAIAVNQLNRLLWIAQGNITSWGERTVPSYKSLFPVRLFVQVRNVTGMEPGFYNFDTRNQRLVPVSKEAQLSLPNFIPSLGTAPVLIAAFTETQAQPPALMEAGGVAQNVLLGSVELELATHNVPAAMLPADAARGDIFKDLQLLWIMPVGKRS